MVEYKYRIKERPRGSSHYPEPGPQRKERTVDTSKSSARTPSATKDSKTRQLRCLEERYRNELMGEEERLELRERILRLKVKDGRRA
jgi:hypothetical protein